MVSWRREERHGEPIVGRLIWRKPRITLRLPETAEIWNKQLYKNAVPSRDLITRAERLVDSTYSQWNLSNRSDDHIPDSTFRKL